MNCLNKLKEYEETKTRRELTYIEQQEFSLLWDLLHTSEEGFFARISMDSLNILLDKAGFNTRGLKTESIKRRKAREKGQRPAWIK